MEIYIVQPGDSVDSIADAFQISVQELIYVNQLIPPYALTLGQSLLITTSVSEPLPAAKNVISSGDLFSFGYAYPYISPWVLDQTLPFLSELYIFSYGFTWEGNLIPPVLDDSWMIEAAANAGVPSILTLTPLGPDGNFNNALITSVVQNPSYKKNLTWQMPCIPGGIEFPLPWLPRPPQTSPVCSMKGKITGPWAQRWIPFCS